MDRSDTQLNDEFDPDALLAPFLRTLATAIDNKKLSDAQIQKVAEFFMSYLFEEQVEKDNNEQESEKIEMTEKDIKKFLCLGWYVYAHVIPRALDSVE